MWFLKICRLQYFFNQAFLVDNRSGNQTQDLAILISSPVYPSRCTLEKLLSFTRTSFLSCTIVNPGELIKIVVRINAFLKVFFFFFLFSWGTGRVYAIPYHPLPYWILRGSWRVTHSPTLRTCWVCGLQFPESLLASVISRKWRSLLWPFH